MTMEELHRKMVANQEKLGETKAQLAAMRGELRGSMIAALQHDEVLANNLRAREWRRHDPALVLSLKGDAITGMPEGWPPGVDGGEVLDTFIQERVDKAVSVEASPASRPDSPSARRLREIIG